MFALISPVTTSTEGLCVATIKWIHTARAFCAILVMHNSVSFLVFLFIIKSASSSMIMIILGTRSLEGTFSLYSVSFFTLIDFSSVYLFSISFTAHFRILSAFSGAVSTGASKYGIPSYIPNSTCFGSTIKNFISEGEFWYIKERINVLIATDLPDHVAHATSRWGMFSSGFRTNFPSIPIHKTRFVKFLLTASANPAFSMICLTRTKCDCGFGISIPTTSVPGIGASILRDFVFNARAKSFW